MIAIFLYLWFGPYRRFRAGLAAQRPLPAAAAALERIRRTVTLNLALGLDQRRHRRVRPLLDGLSGPNVSRETLPPWDGKGMRVHYVVSVTL